MAELHGMHGLALFVAAVAGLAIAHRAVLRLPTGLPRLAFILPILPIFFMLPWTIPNYHLRAILSFVFLWTVPSKLLLLCWDAGIDYPSSGFLYFATIVMLPIRVKGKKGKKEAPHSTHHGQFWCQFIAVIVILNIYSYRNGLPLWAIYVLYACHIYLGLELLLGGLAKLATACFGVESDPQFNNPFMSASLSEFWGRRWNLVVTTILRSTVYNPALLLLMRAEKQKAQQSKVQEKLNNHASSEFKPIFSQERENPVTNGNPQSTHCDGSIATTMNNFPISESLDTDSGSSSEQASSEHGPHCGDRALSGDAISAESLHTVKDSMGSNQNDHSLISNHKVLCKPDVNPNRNKNLHPSSYSEVSRLGAKDGINGREIPSAGIAARVNGCNHMNPGHCASNPTADCNPKPCPILSAFHLNTDPTSKINRNPCAKNDLNLNPIFNKPDPLLSTPNLTSNLNSDSDPAICRDAAENGMLRGTMKPSLRVRVGLILARAAITPNPKNPFAKSDANLSDTDSMENSNPKDPSPELQPAMYKIATEEKGEMDSRREKPSLRAKAVAMLVTFAVSGLVHELIFYYISKTRATGEVTAFFILHGCATAMEVLLKKTMLAQVRLPRPLSIALTLAFLYATAAWLFMPPLTRNGADINTIAEYQRLQSALISLFINK